MHPDRTLEGHQSARKRGKNIGGAGVADDHMLSMALHLWEQEMSLRDIAAWLVITTGKKKGRPTPLTRDRHAHAARARRADSLDGTRTLTCNSVLPHDRSTYAAVINRNLGKATLIATSSLSGSSPITRPSSKIRSAACCTGRESPLLAAYLTAWARAISGRVHTQRGMGTVRSSMRTGRTPWTSCAPSAAGPPALAIWSAIVEGSM
ncbi:hypothetical protein ACFYW6_31725 [Streptomyces sp. NPDC002659]|uniref:hypothetical protein n=1 Tax=Streptomyces sp. NPDC002659 TaxID=3364656 RepID=UPI0036AA95D9